jgi:glycosyltransferase involved in cell wall biosynthesis
MEAGLHKCAMVATPKGGTREIVPSDEQGVIIPDSRPETICNAVNELILDPERRKRLAHKSSIYIKDRFDIRKNTRLLLSYLENL